jgi:hypothetical protein
MSKERAEPPVPDPVTVGAVRYEALLWGKARGLEQNGGYIEAFDVRTGESLWVLKVYDVDYDVDMEPDKLDVFIEELSADEEGRLLVLNEKGRRFRVDPNDRSVREVLN